MTLMGEGAGDIEDRDWARELFGAARGATEPGWGADLAVITRAGDRRRRLRMAGTGGGLLGAVAVTVAAAVTLGAGVRDLGSAPGPGGGWGGRHLQDVFKYAQIQGGGGGMVDPSTNPDFFHHVPKPAAEDVAALIGHLDPAGTHLLGSPAGPDRDQPRIVGDGDKNVGNMASIFLGSLWSPNGSFPDPAAYVTPPSGRVEYNFYKDVSALRQQMPNGPQNPCGLAVDMGLQYRNPDSKTPLPQWSECRYTTLTDGSKVGTTSTALGPGTETVAVRIFRDGNVAALLGWDYSVQGAERQNGVIAPSTVVKPAPWSEASLRAALSDPDIGPVFDPVPPPNADGRLLAPTDLGPDWSYDVHGQVATGEYVMDNGCSPDHSVFGLAAGRGLDYAGTLPGGVPATAFEGEYRLPAGTGAATMRDARKYAQGGCDVEKVGFSKDTVTPLPAGLGDEAFVENQPQQGTVRVNLRFGDTILETTIDRTDGRPLDLTSADGRAWLEGVARQMSEHWVATGSRPGAPSTR